MALVSSIGKQTGTNALGQPIFQDLSSTKVNARNLNELKKPVATAPTVTPLANPLSGTQTNNIMSAPKKYAQSVYDQKAGQYFDVYKDLDSWYGDYKNTTLKNLGVANEDEFYKQTGIQLDSFKSEYENLLSSKGDISALDNLIGEQYRTLRDTNKNISNLQAQENAVTGTLTGEDNYIARQKTVQSLVNQGITNVDQIATQTSLSPDIVRSLINNDRTLYSSITGEKFGVNQATENAIKEQSGYNTALQRLEEDYALAKKQGSERYNQIAQDFDTKIQRQNQQNQIIENNMNMLSGLTGAGYSNRGAIGMENVLTQSKNIISDMQTLRDRSLTEVQNYLDQLSTGYVRSNEDLQMGLEESIKNTTNGFFTAIEAIKTKYGEVSDEAVTRLNDATAKYIEQVNDFQNTAYENMLQNYNLMKTNVDYAMTLDKQAQEKQAQMAQELVYTGASFKDVMAMVQSGQMTPEVARNVQAQMVKATMDSIDAVSGVDGIGFQFQQQILQGLESGQSPYDIRDTIQKDPAYIKATQEQVKDKGFGFSNMGGGVIAVTDPVTGNVTFKNVNDTSNSSSSGGGQIRLNETPVDTGIPSVLGGNVKLAPTVAKMVQTAQAQLKEQGIDLKIADSYRSTETQANAYASGKPGVAPPGSSFHELGQAFDLSQSGKDGMNNEKVFQALRDAGLQQLPGERRHWSYGEMGGGKPTSNLSALAQAAVQSKTISGTPTVQSGIIEELQKEGYFDKGEGNSVYYTTNAEKKQEVQNAASGFAKRDEFMSLYNKAKADGTLEGMTGTFDSKSNNMQAAMGLENKAYNDMNRILQKELSTYMNKISGATVSEPEVERLRQQIPNMSMGDKQFQDAVEAYNTSIRGAKGFMKDLYGLSDAYVSKLGGGISADPYKKLDDIVNGAPTGQDVADW